MNTSPGLMLARDRYRLLSRLAVGGMGEVWRAADELLGRDVAIKILKDEYADDESFRSRFRAEARNTAGLSHPGIAQMYDYGEQENLAYLVMELVPGQPLSDILARSGRLSPDVTLDVVTQAARALQAAHEAGLIHRDIKPGNLIVEPDGVVKVTDFGIARLLNATTMTQTGTVLGTAQYVSPEQAEGQQLTPATDIYSLGIVAYECLAGQTPFSGESAVAIALAQVRDDPPPLPADVPVSVRRLIERCLAKDPHRRPTSADELSTLAYFARESLRLDEAYEGTSATSDGAAGAAALQDMASPLYGEAPGDGDAETSADAMDDIDAVEPQTPPFGTPAQSAAEIAAATSANAASDAATLDGVPYTAFEAHEDNPRSNWRPERRRVLVMGSAVAVAVICASGLMLGFQWDALFRPTATFTDQNGGPPGVVHSPSTSTSPLQTANPAWHDGGTTDWQEEDSDRDGWGEGSSDDSAPDTGAEPDDHSADKPDDPAGTDSFGGSVRDSTPPDEGTDTGPNGDGSGSEDNPTGDGDDSNTGTDNDGDTGGDNDNSGGDKDGSGPSDEPTDEPTDKPTDEPTDEPTDAPTDEPTDGPTEDGTDPGSGA